VAAAQPTNQIACSVGIMAHNEEANVGRLLEAVLGQRTSTARISEIIVIASGCTDGTVPLVERWALLEPRIHLVVQARREGKSAAVNCFLARAREQVLVLCSADIIPAPDTVEGIVAPFADEEVAMTTCRPVPVNDPARFMGFAAHLLWNLHHQINLREFKAGEMIAFRKVFERIPRRSSVDEASVESVIRGQGYAVKYVPDAVTYNKGPETVRDFLCQRRRIYAGHLALRDGVGYRASTLGGLKILGLVLRTLDWRPRQFLWTWAVAALEVWGRLLGRRDHRRRLDQSVWAIASTTKMLGPRAAAPALLAGERVGPGLPTGAPGPLPRAPAVDEQPPRDFA
jgi:cellulose synthase/poly-beta-1,6-N-acetylglucosamine synthase-like glycosyltransferase